MIRIKLEKDGVELLSCPLSVFVMNAVLRNDGIKLNLPVTVIIEDNNKALRVFSRLTEVIEDEEVEDDNG